MLYAMVPITVSCDDMVRQGYPNIWKKVAKSVTFMLLVTVSGSHLPLT